MSLIIGTGYWKADQKCEDFYVKHWLPNTLKYADPEKIIVTNSASPPIKSPEIVQWLNLTANPAHGTKLKENIQFEGWSLGFIHGALYAHSCHCDYIFKEQDCLAFGPWVERMYAACEGKQMVTGELWNHPKRDYTIELSLMLIKYEFIIPFLAQLFADLGMGNKVRPEKKFLTIRDNNPDSIGTIDFGYGGNRPFKCDDCFYIQKPRWKYETQTRIKTAVGSGIPSDEIAMLQKEKLL
jgi:hypothetical protein